jgi:3-oxoacyl-[acyl-carrier protein] reductase
VEVAGRLAGKIVLVTAGSRGIGAEIVRRLAAEGADIGFTYRTGKAEAEAVAGQERGLARRALVVKADLADSAAAGAVVDAVAGTLTANTRAGDPAAAGSLVEHLFQ